MKEYGLDGVFMQRFVADIRHPKIKNHFDTVLQNAMISALKYERAISIMYDLSGIRKQDVELVLTDIDNIVCLSTHTILLIFTTMANH